VSICRSLSVLRCNNKSLVELRIRTTYYESKTGIWPVYRVLSVHLAKSPAPTPALTTEFAPQNRIAQVQEPRSNFPPVLRFMNITVEFPSVLRFAELCPLSFTLSIHDSPVACCFHRGTLQRATRDCLSGCGRAS
jgi:hypothetical protein